MVWECFFLRDVSEEHKKLSLEEETMWLRIRSLTLRLISGLPSLNHSVGPKNSEKTTENGVSSRIDILRLLLQQLEVALETGKRFIEKDIQVSSVVFVCLFVFIISVYLQSKLQKSVTVFLKIGIGVV